MFSSVHKFNATVEGAGAMSRMRDGKAEMSPQSRMRRLNGSRRQVEISVPPIVPRLRRSVSVPEISRLRKQTHRLWRH